MTTTETASSPETNGTSHGSHTSGTTNTGDGTRPLRIAVVIGSTRPEKQGEVVGIERKGRAVGEWVHEHAVRRGDAEVELIDLLDVGLPLLDEPLPPSFGRYTQPHTRAWAARIAACDGFVFVTPEYNRSPPAALKNAIDFLYAEWHDKAAAFVGYGAVGGAHAVEQLRTVLSELRVAHVQSPVSLGLYTDFVDLLSFAPAAHQAAALDHTLDQLLSWAGALRSVREGTGD